MKIKKYAFPHLTPWFAAHSPVIPVFVPQIRELNIRQLFYLIKNTNETKDNYVHPKEILLYPEETLIKLKTVMYNLKKSYFILKKSKLILKKSYFILKKYK